MPKPKSMQGVKSPKKWTFLEDSVMANRYLYYVSDTPVLTDTNYDKMEKDCHKEKGYGNDSPVSRVGSSDKACYPSHVRALALYIGLKYAKRKSNG
jgi:NAD-dependent DNA ligase